MKYSPQQKWHVCLHVCVCRVTAPESKDAHTRNRSWAESTQSRLNSKTRVFISANERLLGRTGGFLKWVLKLEVINILSTSLRAYGNSSTQSKESTSRGEEEKIFWVTGGHRRPLHPQSLSKDLLCPPELFMWGLSLLPLLDCGVLRGEINSSLPQPKLFTLLSLVNWFEQNNSKLLLVNITGLSIKELLFRLLFCGLCFF